MADLIALRKRVSLTMKHFSPTANKPRRAHDRSESRSQMHDFPVPGLALFVLRDVMGFRDLGPDEKVRWTITCAFEGYPCAFELRKFGFVAFVAGDRKRLNRALAALHKAMKLTEPALLQDANIQATAGNVTISNRMADFEGRYRFFREEASTAYVMPDPPMQPISWDKDGNPNGFSGSFGLSEQRGHWLASAMIDAFFSRFEHQAILLLGFTAFDPSGGVLVKLIRDNWEAKFKALFDISTDRDAKLHYDALKSLKEKFRNPQAHGGFEKGWNSLYFHVPKIGALPGNLLSFSQSSESKLTPMDLQEYHAACTLLDRVDAYISVRLRLPLEFITGTALSVAFDARSRREYRKAVVSDTEFELFIRGEIYQADRHANMDYSCRAIGTPGIPLVGQ